VIPRDIGAYSLICNVLDTICLGPGDESRVDRRHRIITRPARFVCDKPAQVGARLMGLVFALSYTCRTCLCNAHNALCNRHLSKQPTTTKSFIHSLMALGLLRARLRLAYADRSTEGFLNWLSKWPLAKRLNIARSVARDDVIPDRVKYMVKRESGHALVTKARGIQMYWNLATQEAFARECSSLQKACSDLFHFLDVGSGITITFASGFNALTLGAWMARAMASHSVCKFYERDGKNWDSTMSLELLEFKNQFYDVVDAGLANFARRCVTVTGAIYSDENCIKYRVSGTTKSGHNDTSLGNSIINAFVAFESMVLCGLSGDILVAGDDLLVVVSGDFDVELLLATEASFGILPVGRKFDSVEHVSFISGVWFPSFDSYIFTPKPGRLLARLFWCTDPPSSKKHCDWVHSVVLGLWPVCQHLPVIREFLSVHACSGARIAVSKMQTYDVDVGCVDTFSVRECFMRRYDLTINDIDEVVGFIRYVGPNPKVGYHPVITKIMDVDLADCTDRPIYPQARTRFGTVL